MNKQMFCGLNEGQSKKNLIAAEALADVGVLHDATKGVMGKGSNGENRTRLQEACSADSSRVFVHGTEVRTLGCRACMLSTTLSNGERVALVTLGASVTWLLAFHRSRLTPSPSRPAKRGTVWINHAVDCQGVFSDDPCRTQRTHSNATYTEPHTRIRGNHGRTSNSEGGSVHTTRAVLHSHISTPTSNSTSYEAFEAWACNGSYQ